MLNKKLVDKYLTRLDLDDFNISKFDRDDNGDFIKVVLPELDFELINRKILETKFFNEKLDTFSFERLSLKFEEMLGGYNTFYRMIVDKEKFGISITLIVKRVDYYNIDGNHMPLLGFGMLKEILDIDKSKEDKIKLRNKKK